MTGVPTMRRGGWRTVTPIVLGSALTYQIIQTMRNPRGSSSFFFLTPVHTDQLAKSFNLKEKLPIYDPPEPLYEEVPIPENELERNIRGVRTSVTSAWRATQNGVMDMVSGWIDKEQAVIKALRKLKGPDEQILPNGFYSLVAGFTGSILVRNRSILSRLFVPPTLFVLSSALLLPQTTHNVYSTAVRHLPTDVQAHIDQTEQATRTVLRDLTAKVSQARIKLTELSTGLNPTEAIPRRPAARQESGRGNDPVITDAVETTPPSGDARGTENQ